MRMAPKIISLTIVRHGESEGNVQRVMQGHCSGFPLSDQGKNQATLVGKSLKDIKFDRIYTSDLERALETAILIHQNNGSYSKQGSRIVEITQSSLLRERDFGIYNLSSKEDFFQGAKDAGHQNDEDFKPESGENDKDVTERVKEFLGSLLDNININEKSKEISERQRNYRFLIATHGGWIMRFIRYMSKFAIIDPDSHCEEVKDYGNLAIARGIANTAVFTFDIAVNSENPEIISYNCTKCNSTAHLQ